MCGVAGVFHYGDPERRVDRAVLQRMTDILRHRGPDDEGAFIAGPVGLGHRRLTIVDLTVTGRQPMATDDGQFTISYNGEFYDHRDFRARLEARGRRFRGTSDTETLLLLLAEYGPRVLSDIAGIFAFALWDAAERRLILARDPLGVKQLYYHDDGRRIVFASEIKALFVHPDVPRELNPQGLNDYLHFHTPLFDRTFFRGIHQVRPGEYIEISSAGVRRRIYSETDGFAPRHETPQAAVEELKELLVKVIGQQLMSDVPIGAFFSGGIDSSAVAAFSRRAGKRVKGFGIHFSNSTVIDERPYQEAAAKALDVDLELTTVDGTSFPEDLLKLTWFQDQPIIGPAMIPMFHVSKLAARHVKVCLGGQGADEIFGGYARYALVNPAQVLALWFSRPTTASDNVGSPNAEVGGNLIKQLGDVRNIQRLLRRVQPAESWESRYFSNFADVPPGLWKRVFPDPALISRAGAREEFARAIARSPAHNRGDRVLHWDIQTYLTGLFHQDDRMSMANSLESRVPMADPRLVRFALHTDFSLKLRGGATKWILRQALADVVPESVLNRRKVGFDTPAEHWMRTTHREFVRDLLLSEAARSRGYWDPNQVRAILDNDKSPYWFHLTWKLASLEAWARGFLDAPAAAPAPVEVIHALA